jgi:hypothetical protein
LGEALADLKLGAATYMDMQVARFTGQDAAPYAAALKFITDRGNVSEADIKGFMAQGIAAEVDAQFNRVSFLLRGGTRGSYNAVLTRNANNQYILSYEDANDVVNTFPPANSLNALSSAMRNSGDFSQSAIDTVRAQAALIPAVKLPPKELEAIKDILTLFYLNPNTGTYNAVRDVHKIYSRLSVFSARDNAAYTNVNDSYVNAVGLLNLELGRKMVLDVRNDSNIASTKTVEAIAQEVSQRQ